MANRRQLKKTIAFIADEMVNELYFRSLIHPGQKEEDLVALVVAIMAQKREFINRVSHTEGKDAQHVKTYYRALYKDWDEAVGKVWEEIQKI